MVPYWPAVLCALVLLLINSMLQIIGPLLTKAAVDRYLVPVPEEISSWWAAYLSDDPRTGLGQLAGIYCAIILAGLLLQYGQHYLMQWTGQKAMFRLRRQLMDHLQKLDIGFYDRNPVGRLVTRMTTDVDTLNELFSSGLVAIIADVMMLSFVIVVMFKLNVGLTLFLLGAAPFVIGATYLFRRAVSLNYRRIRIALAKMNAHIQEHVSGIAVLQLFNREARSQEEFEIINRSHMEAYKDTINAYGWFYPVVEFIGMLALAGLLAYGGYEIDRGTMTLGVLLAFFQYGMRFFRPVQDLSEKYNIMQSAVTAAERIFLLLDAEPGVRAPADPKPLSSEAATVEFDHVWFAYENEDWVLRDVSFTIEPGETIASRDQASSSSGSPAQVDRSPAHDPVGSPRSRFVLHPSSRTWLGVTVRIVSESLNAAYSARRKARPLSG